MISKMKPVADDPRTPWIDGGSRIGIVLSGSPMFSGGAESNESEIRRWIIENDWLEAIVALPDQMFYNTGINTYVWILSNRKSPARTGLVTLVDARDLGTKMRKSLGNKRKELTPEAIQEVTRLYSEALDHVGGDECDPRVKVMPNQDFGFARITVERPLRRLWSITDDTVAAVPDAVREKVAALTGLTWDSEADAKTVLGAVGFDTKTVNAVLKAIAVSDPSAQPTPAKKGSGFEPDPDLRDAENIPLPDGYLDMSPTEQTTAVMLAAEAHLKTEIHPYVPDAWIDHSKTKIGYEIPFTRQFYVYTPPRPVDEIRADIDVLEAQIQDLMGGLAR